MTEQPQKTVEVPAELLQQLCQLAAEACTAMRLTNEYAGQRVYTAWALAAAETTAQNVHEIVHSKEKN